MVASHQLETPLPHMFEPTDNEIARAVMERFEWSVQVPEDRIDVKVLNGRVTLIGWVDWRYQRLAAEAVLHDIAGIRGITNLVRVRPQPYDADVREKVVDLAWIWQHGCC